MMDDIFDVFDMDDEIVAQAEVEPDWLTTS